MGGLFPLLFALCNPLLASRGNIRKKWGIVLQQKIESRRRKLERDENAQFFGGRADRDLIYASVEWPLRERKLRENGSVLPPTLSVRSPSPIYFLLSLPDAPKILCNLHYAKLTFTYLLRKLPAQAKGKHFR